MIALWVALALADEPEPAPDPLAEAFDLMHRVADSGYAQGASLLAVAALESHLDHPRAPLARLELSRFQRDNGLLFEEEKTLARGISAHPTRWRPWFELAILDARLQRHDWEGLAREHDGRAEWPGEIQDAAQFYGAWGRAGIGDDDGARVLLAKVRGPLQPAAREFSLALEEVPVHHRSPLLAGALNVVPGVGHFYAGDVPGGLADLLLTGALGGGAVYAYTRDEDVWMYVLGVLGGASLLTGIGDASRQAVAFNNASARHRFDTLESRWWLRGSLTGNSERPVDVAIALPESP